MMLFSQDYLLRLDYIMTSTRMAKNVGSLSCIALEHLIRSWVLAILLSLTRNCAIIFLNVSYTIA